MFYNALAAACSAKIILGDQSKILFLQTGTTDRIHKGIPAADNTVVAAGYDCKNNA